MTTLDNIDKILSEIDFKIKNYWGVMMNQSKSPYSAYRKLNGTYYISGQLPLDKEKNCFPESIEEQTAMSLKNLNGVIQEAGLEKDDLQKVTIFMKNISDYEKMNEVYANFFDQKFPARSAFEVGNLPKGALIEIEAIAGKDIS